MALRRLLLRDFVIVSQLELDLRAGFTVLTGETGAGKSILIDALQLALGGRSDVLLVREGCPRTEVSAEFDTSPVVRGWLEQAGFEVADTLLLRRSLDVQGKSRAWINGSAATAAQLREIGEQLVDIHGQHAWQSLTRAPAQRALLDAYAGIELAPLHAAWQHWRAAQQSLEQAHAAQQNLQHQRERLHWQISELDKLAPGLTEWGELNAQHTRLAHAQTLMDAAQEARQILSLDPQNALQRLSQVRESLSKVEHLEVAFKPLTELLSSSLAQAEDVAHSLGAWLRHTELEPERLAELDARLGLWLSLARRYRSSPEQLPSLYQSWQAELAQLDAAADLAALQAAAAQAEQRWAEQAQRVSQQRLQAAPQLSQAITRAMQGLGMAGGSFTVALHPAEPPTQAGLEEVAFLVSGHAGSTARPVGKVASGGELSRIALAIAVTTSALGAAQTLIFDEVDAGVGGAVAETVGRLMQRLGRDRQVLAVTHLAQVAARANAHLVVAKQRVGEHTVSSVTAVCDALRVAEIARMLGGERLTDTTRAHALELLSA